MPSNEFQNEVGDFLSKYYEVVHRIHDCAFNRNLGRSVTPKPFDFFGADNEDKLFGAEVKRVKSTSIPFTNFSEHQIEALLQLEENGWIFINWRISKYGESPYSRVGTAVWIDVKSFLNIYNNNDKKSLNPYDFSDKWFLTRRTGGWIIENHPLMK